MTPDAPLCLSKVCNLEDFSHPSLLAVLRQVFPHECERFGPNFPAGREYRKHWEVVMAVRALAVGGVLRDWAELLGIGAGNEPTLFWLTNRVRRVWATDLYCEGEDWRESANATMLHDPGRHWPGPWDPRRLVVQHMNALELRYEDNSFDGIFSSSSLEHFGTPEDIRRAAGEMCRVLKPGGILALSTEYRLAGPPPGLPGILMFDADQLDELLVDGLPWDWFDPLDAAVSPATRATEQPFADAANDVRRHVAEHGHILFHRLDWHRYPHLVLSENGLAWTSVHVTLRKRAA
jgi:SAM-dependent methyltransferase